MDNFKGDVLQKYQALKNDPAFCRISQNLSHSDRWAQSWLAENPHIIDVPADKGLGTVLTLRSNYESLVSVQLEKSFHQVDADEAQVIQSTAVKSLNSCLKFGIEHQAICEQQEGYLSCLTERARIPRIRALIKVHKVAIAARLIVANTMWVTTPAAIFISLFIQQCMAVFEYVANSTADVLDALKTVKITEDMNMHTFDVDNMYPSLDQATLIIAVRLSLTAHFTAHPSPKWGAKVEFIVMLVTMVLKAQVTTWSKRDSSKTFWQQHIGVSIGLACGSQLANCYLRTLDIHITSTFRASIIMYKRYIDDVLIISTRNILQQLIVAFNEYDDHISISHDAANEDERCTLVSFLDLEIAIVDSQLTYRTFRKPMATYNYLPYESCHSQQCKDAIVFTEILRIIRTCSTNRAAEEEISFTLQKFRDRGYNVVRIRDIADRARNGSLKLKTASKQKIVPLKFHFSCIAHKLGLADIIRNNLPSLPSTYRDTHRLVTCYLSGRSLFRERYKRFF